MTKIHVCCGANYLDGYTNIDKYEYEEGDTSRKGCVADVIADVFDLDYEPGSIKEIVLTHGIEHFPKYEGSRLMEKLLTFLSDDGVLYIEHPNRNTVMFLYVFETALAMFGFRKNDYRNCNGAASSMIWGNQWSGLDYETHRYLWSSNEVLRLCKDREFKYSKKYRYTASHVPFRDIGIAVSKSSAAIKLYSPPKLARYAKVGLNASIAAFIRGVVSLFRQRNGLK